MPDSGSSAGISDNEYVRKHFHGFLPFALFVYFHTLCPFCQFSIAPHLRAFSFTREAHAVQPILDLSLNFPAIHAIVTTRKYLSYSLALSCYYECQNAQKGFQCTPQNTFFYQNPLMSINAYPLTNLPLLSMLPSPHAKSAEINRRVVSPARHSRGLS